MVNIMKVELLNKSHRQALEHLFYRNKYMGVNLEETGSASPGTFSESDPEFLYTVYNIFCDTYLSDLLNFKAFGTFDDDGIITSYVSFYESVETPDWFWTQVRSKNHSHIKYALDAAIKYNEDNNRYKFFSMFNLKYADSYRRLAFSDYNRERYDFVNEFVVPAKTKCVYLVPWQILFNRMLMPVDSLVRCAFLKSEYRPELPVAGFL
jgi:hypothetical protein